MANPKYQVILDVVRTMVEQLHQWDEVMDRAPCADDCLLYSSVQSHLCQLLLAIGIARMGAGEAYDARELERMRVAKNDEKQRKCLAVIRTAFAGRTCSCCGERPPKLLSDGSIFYTVLLDPVPQHCRRELPAEIKLPCIHPGENVEYEETFIGGRPHLVATVRGYVL